jgi:hypothetical protein
MVLERGLLIVTSALVRRLLPMIVVVGIMCACREKFESQYPSAADAAKAGEFDRGWLPEVLKPDAMNIREWHDIASNEVRGRFALNERVLNRLQSSCKPRMDVPRKTWSMPDWFPDSIARGNEAAHGMRVFRCDDFFIAVDTAATTGYFWTKYPSDQNHNVCCRP